MPLKMSGLTSGAPREARSAAISFWPSTTAIKVAPQIAVAKERRSSALFLRKKFIDCRGKGNIAVLSRKTARRETKSYSL